MKNAKEAEKEKTKEVCDVLKKGLVKMFKKLFVKRME